MFCRTRSPEGGISWKSQSAIGTGHSTRSSVRNHLIFALSSNGNCNRVGLITHIPFRLNAAPREGYLYCPACGTGYGKLHHRFKGKKLQTGDRFGIGIDMDRQLLHFFKNEEHMGSISTRLPKEVWVIAYLNDNCSEVSLEARDFPMLPAQLVQIAPQQASAVLEDSPVEDEFD